MKEVTKKHAHFRVGTSMALRFYNTHADQEDLKAVIWGFYYSGLLLLGTHLLCSSDRSIAWNRKKMTANKFKKQLINEAHVCIKIFPSIFFRKGLFILILPTHTVFWEFSVMLSHLSLKRSLGMKIILPILQTGKLFSDLPEVPTKPRNWGQVLSSALRCPFEQVVNSVESINT